MTHLEHSADHISQSGGLRSQFGEEGCVAVIAAVDHEHTCELLGDACDLAFRLKKPVHVLAFEKATKAEQAAQELFHAGADEVTLATLESNTSPFANLQARLVVAHQWQRSIRPWITFIGGGGAGRPFAARLAARCECELFSPALSVAASGNQLHIMALHSDGRRARQAALPANRAGIVVLHKGVGQARPADPTRAGKSKRIELAPQPEAVLSADFQAADPATADIQHLPRLVAGGNGLGGPEGFELLRSVAKRLDAGVAASRMAVDQGWIDRERQVGQSGKTVRPELYLACGISGASHHLEGMSQSRHVVAINRDPQAPIFRTSHLGLVADWRETMLKLDEALAARKNGAL